MNTVMAYDINGECVTTLVQWDKDVHICISDTFITKACNVHFFNQDTEKAYVVVSTYSNNVLTVKIPNVLLSQPYPIVGYVYADDNSENKSICRFKINILKRPQPMDYVYDDTKDYITLEEVLDECRNFASAASGYASDASNSARKSESYAVGGTGTRENEEQDNARYYYIQSKDKANEATISATNADKSNKQAEVNASAASGYASDASNSAIQAGSLATQIEEQKEEIDKIINESLLASSDKILSAIQDYFNQAEALYRSCAVICDGENPQRRARTIVRIECHTPQRRATNYVGIKFDGGTPAIRLLGE